MQSDQCASCKHYQGAFICPAFPGGIPDEIFKGIQMHDQPTEDQEGTITWEEAPEVEFKEFEGNDQ